MANLTFFRRHDCICQLPVQRNTFMQMAVYQEEGSPTAWISVDECEERLLPHQFMQLYRLVESRTLGKLEVNNYTILRETLKEMKQIAKSNKKPQEDFRNYKAAATLGAIVMIGFFVVIFIAIKMYL